MILGQVLNGLIVGSMYALVALGFTLVLGSLHRLNLAHPEVLMCGGFVALETSAHGVPFALGLPIALLVGGFLGLLVELVSFRRARGEDAEVAAALSSVAVGVVMVDLVQKVWGTEPAPLPATAPPATFAALGVRFTALQLAIVAVAALLMVSLHLLVTRTSIGRQIRAVADDPAAASLFGVEVATVTRAVFFLSSALACAAGFLLATRLGAANSDIGLAFGLKALAVMAIGGMGDLRGAMLGGFVVGVLESLAVNYGLGRLTDLFVWTGMIAVLVWRPQGLIGRTSQDLRA